MEQTQFQVGDLVVWSEPAWAKHLHNQNNPSRFFVYCMPPAGFYKITEIYDDVQVFYAQSLECPSYERSYDIAKFATTFDLVSEKHQDDAALILSLDDIGLL